MSLCAALPGIESRGSCIGHSIRISRHLRRVYLHAQSIRQSTSTHPSLLAWRPDDVERIWHIIARLFPDLKVVRGPFKELLYPGVESVGSSIAPKLLGLYESELHQKLDELLGNGYSTIVDIGCAEGYYAVGLALRLPLAKIYAFDTSPSARFLCAKMAKANGVADRVHIAGLCNENILRSLPLKGKTLIVCDCEGYEAVLFNRELAEYLSDHDLIIETHDFIDIEISSKLRDAFAVTHSVYTVKSIDAIEKVHQSNDPILASLSSRDKYLILKEGRPAIMEWLIMTSKRTSQGSS